MATKAAEEASLEVHYIGELEVGWEFPALESNEGLFVDYSADAGSEWLPIARKEGFVGQTQTSYADAGGVYVFNHPIDFHFIADSLDRWPRLHVQVFKLDAAGRVETVSYGSVNLPSMSGHSEITCRTWRPLNMSTFDEARAAHAVGGDAGMLPAGRADILDGRVPEVRSKMVTKTSGTVCLSLDTVLRNAGKHGILLPHRASGGAGSK
ncbi:unnamed protein product [Polarella glacialis]|uniref:B9 domain-containing protein 2 n=1 Tax=Polarella glacialis TaxID=89957 RepID=A0A813FM06_POLGL|nr:unnamed protein product [Polarella glacialis]